MTGPGPAWRVLGEHAESNDESRHCPQRREPPQQECGEGELRDGGLGNAEARRATEEGTVSHLLQSLGHGSRYPPPALNASQGGARQGPPRQFRPDDASGGHCVLDG